MTEATWKMHESAEGFYRRAFPWKLLIKVANMISRHHWRQFAVHWFAGKKNVAASWLQLVTLVNISLDAFGKNAHQKWDLH